MSFDELNVRAETAADRATDVYRRLEETYEDFLEHERRHDVSRRRFSTLVDRIRRTGTPFGVHTIVYRERERERDGESNRNRGRSRDQPGEILLVRHDGVDLWVLPGGEIDPGESLLGAARRELEEEAGIEARYDGLAMVTRLRIHTMGYWTQGVLPIFAARAVSDEPEITDPDEEISDARWFSSPPEDTRDRGELLAWWEHHF